MNDTNPRSPLSQWPGDPNANPPGRPATPPPGFPGSGSGAPPGWIPPAPGWPPPAAPQGWPPPPPPEGWPPPPHGRSLRRGWVIAAGALAAVVAVGAIVLLTLTGHQPHLPGRTPPTTRVQAAAPGPPAAALHAVARFITLEVARNNDIADFQPDGNPPDPVRGFYEGVSCQADLDQMAATGPTPPTPQSPRYTFTIKSTTPTTDSRYLLVLHALDTQTGRAGDGSYYLQLESNRWVVCGLYFKNAPPSTGDGSGGSGSGGGSGDTSIDNSAGGRGSALTSSNPRAFRAALPWAVGTAGVNT
jgi:hypothetical protein